MKRITALLFILVLAIPAFARDARPKLKRLAPGSLKVERLANPRAHALRILRQAREATKNPGAEAIIVNRSARALVIPAAGNVPGQGGTHFRSDITFANWNSEDQLLGIMWLPNGNPDGLELMVTMMPALSIFTEEDFVGGFMDLEGLGSIILFPLAGEAGDFDPDAAIDAYSRIWTPQPGATGTVSQPFPAVEPDYMTNEEAGIILGLRQDAGYRTNYGILNISEDDLTFELDIFAEGGQDPETRTITVPSLSMIQTSIPGGNFGPLSIGLSLPTPPTINDFTWLGFASSTDNFTGDGWVSIVANPWDDDRLDEVEDN
jgi:hypothetical protein